MDINKVAFVFDIDERMSFLLSVLSCRVILNQDRLSLTFNWDRSILSDAPRNLRRISKQSLDNIVTDIPLFLGFVSVL